MRLAYLDCFAGISGDMFLGALLEAGVPVSIFHDAIASLHIGASLTTETVDRSGISCTRVHVLENDQPAEALPTHQHHPETQHQHKGGHSHPAPTPTTDAELSHSRVHTHGRSLSAILKIIASSHLNAPVQSRASAIFTLLGYSEAKIHNVPVEDIHFHEVGAVDAIVDIVCASAGIEHLHVQRWYASPVNVGSGMVDCAHGRFPVPAPATADLLRGLPTYAAHVEKELVTPTGAAILRSLEATFGPQPPMRVASIGYGAGSRNPEGFPNVLRLSLGEQTSPEPDTSVTVLETALDDLSPQILAHVTESALALGALDVMTTAVGMKKGRQGTLLTILADDTHAPALERLLLRETTTLGIRVRRDRRTILDRTFASVTTPYGPIRIKIGSLHGEELNAAPEFEDCRAAAAAHNVPLKQVIQQALILYFSNKPAN